MSWVRRRRGSGTRQSGGSAVCSILVGVGDGGGEVACAGRVRRCRPRRRRLPRGGHLNDDSGDVVVNPVRAPSEEANSSRYAASRGRPDVRMGRRSPSARSCCEKCPEPFDLRRGTGEALGRGALEEFQRLVEVPRRAQAACATRPEHEERFRLALRRSEAPPLHGFVVGLRHALVVVE
ncbi:hypothetical protein M885DRAFT_240087 [Pelagophyceae sp. CCMP2097]|nr:hypothetical protein M885DRAFT_240087 [Pelagophyceae sp. CCMP2097]